MAKSKKNGMLRTYKSYLFVEKDPIIDALRTAVSESHMKYSELRNESGVSTTTLRNWFHGATRRPMFSTVSAVTRAMGKSAIHYNRQGRPYLRD